MYEAAGRFSALQEICISTCTTGNLSIMWPGENDGGEEGGEGKATSAGDKFSKQSEVGGEENS